MNKILTIAVPVYNMEQYLGRCLDSLIASRHLDELEVIVINDGSKDGSLKIAKEYETKAPNSFRVVDKPNGGWGSAINLSIREAKGKYWKSLDSDDWYDTDALDSLVEDLRNLEVDCVLTPHNTVDVNGVVTEKKLRGEENGKIEDLEEYIRKYKGLTSIHGKLFKTALLQENKFEVSECFYADLDIDVLPVLIVRTVVQLPHVVYQYFVGREGQSVSLEGYKKHYNDYIRVTKHLIKGIDRKGEKGESVRNFVNKSLEIHIGHAYYYLMHPEFGGKEPGYKEKLKTFNCEVKKNNHLYKRSWHYKRKSIPYIAIWRIANINVMSLLK